jgi:PAS domain S-box-containing protein
MARLVVKISDELHSDLKKYVVEQHGKIKGELSNTVQEMIKECLDRRKRESDEVGLEERYRELVELAPDLIAIHQDGKFVYINDAGMKTLGAKSANELIGKDVLSVIPPKWRKIHEERIRSIIEDNVQTSRLRTPMLRLDVSIIDVEIITGIRVNYRGKPAVQVWIKDISGLKRAEKMSWDTLRYA